MLLTIGLAFMSVAVAAYFFGTVQQPIETPSFLRGSISVLGVSFGAYRLFLIAMGAGGHAAARSRCWSTRASARRCARRSTTSAWRAAWASMSTAAFAITFALGSGLAGLGGALAIEIVGLDHSFALAYLVYVLIVVSVGGLGSIGGSFAAAALLGISDMFGKYYFPQLGAFLIYLVMIAILMWRPAGLFGRR